MNENKNPKSTKEIQSSTRRPSAESFIQRAVNSSSAEKIQAQLDCRLVLKSKHEYTKVNRPLNISFKEH